MGKSKVAEKSKSSPCNESGKGMLRSLMEKILIRFFRWSSTRRDRRGWRCPGESQLAAYADHRLAGREKDRVEAHLADCHFCLGQVAFLARHQAAQLPEDVPAPLLERARGLVPLHARPALSLVLRWQALVATAACLVIVGAVTLRRPQRPVAPPRPPTTEAPTSRTPARTTLPAETPSVVPRTVRKVPAGVLPPVVILPRDGAVVSRSKLEFRWEPVEGSLDYEVRIVDAEGSVVWERRTGSPALDVPADVNLKSGRKYFVWIRAFLAGGGTVQSKAVGFRLAEAH